MGWDDVSKFLCMDYVWCLFLGERSSDFVCLDRMFVSKFLGKPFPNEGCRISFFRWLCSSYNWDNRKVVWAIG